MSIGQFLSVLIARWKIAALVFLLCVGAAVGYSLLAAKNYTASAAVLVDVKSPDPIAGILLPTLAMPSYMATQVDIIQSDRVALRVVQRLRLATNPTLREQWQEATEGKGKIEPWIAASLQRNLDVKPARESNVINVAYKGTDPTFAALMANSFVQAYLETNLELKTQPARQYSSFFDERSKELRDNLEKAQSALSSLQRTKGILASDERLDIETARLNELSSQLVSIQALSAESRSRQTESRASPDRMQEVLQNPLIAGLKSDLARQEARLKESASKFGENHPQMIELKANIAELNSKIRSETEKITSSLGVSSNVNTQRETSIRVALDKQRQKVLQMKEARDELAVLQRDAENAQRAYDAVVSRGNQTALEGQSQQTNLALLSPATEPTEPSSPRVLLNTMLGVFAGTLLGVAMALALELLDRRVRSAADLTIAGELPLLGVLPGPDRKRWFGRSRSPLLSQSLVGKLPAPAAH